MFLFLFKYKLIVIQIPPKCNPALSVQIQKRNQRFTFRSINYPYQCLFFLGILMQQQEKLKQKIQDEQQQHSIVPLTPESVAQFLANQTQSQTSDTHPWSIHHSMSAASTFPTFMDNSYYDTCRSVKFNPTNKKRKQIDHVIFFCLHFYYLDKY